MINDYPKILFFVKDSVPTGEEQLEALKYGFNVCLRHANIASTESKTETCDGVAGAVPENYIGLPSADIALHNFSEALKTKIKEQEKTASEALKASIDEIEAAKTAKVKKVEKSKVQWKPNQ
jgi:hypothetical protein